MTKRTTPDGESIPRARLLQTAAELFYQQGIHAVGVDRIVAAAGVTRATFYRHFPSKEDLVEAYLGIEDANIKAGLAAAEAAVGDGDPARLAELLIEGIADDVARHHRRGCPFINAAAEYPDPDSGVRRAVKAHREWFRGEVERILAAGGADEASAAAGQLVLLRDAALVGGYLDGWARVREAFIDSAHAVLDRARAGV